MSYDEYVQAAALHYNMQGLIANHRYKHDDPNIRDTFISHLNNFEEIQKIVNDEHLSPLDSVKIYYSASLFIHTIVRIAECV